MQKKTPKNTDKYYWTQHVVGKMQHYGLSEQKVLGVVKKPYRTETGIASDTVAVMQPVGNVKKDMKSDDGKAAWSQELWVMYQLRDSAAMVNDQAPITKKISNSKNKHIQKLAKLIQSKSKRLYIISAWRFPGVSPKNNPIPDHVWREIEEFL